MTVRTQVSLDPELHRRARADAARQGISFAEYIRRLVAEDLDDPAPRGQIEALFDLGRSGRSDISGDTDRFVGEAVEAEHRRSLG
jgi:hypothetical protein